MSTFVVRDQPGSSSKGERPLIAADPWEVGGVAVYL
jgi:hypothetical protein